MKEKNQNISRIVLTEIKYSCYRFFDAFIHAEKRFKLGRVFLCFPLLLSHSGVQDSETERSVSMDHILKNSFHCELNQGSFSKGTWVEIKLISFCSKKSYYIF